VTPARGRMVRLDSRTAWERARRIGSSDVAKILRKPDGTPISPYGTEWDVWLRLTKRNRRQRREGQAQARGTRWEPIVLHLYAEETRRPVKRPPPFVLWDGPDSWATSSPDALTRDGSARGVVEAKTDVHVDDWGEPGIIERWGAGCERIVRPDYALQCYHLARGLGADYVDLAVLLPYYGLRVYRIVRDESVEAELVEVLGEWYRRHVEFDEPPAIDGSDACRAYIASRFKVALEDHRPGTWVEAAVAQRIQWATAAMKILETQLAVDRNWLLNSIGDAAGLVWGEDGERRRPRVSAVRVKGRERVDLDRLRAERPDLVPVLEQFTGRGDPFAYPRLSNVPLPSTPYSLTVPTAAVEPIDVAHEPRALEAHPPGEAA
jgi:hypothetical protein